MVVLQNVLSTIMLKNVKLFNENVRLQLVAASVGWARYIPSSLRKCENVHNSVDHIVWPIRSVVVKRTLLLFCKCIDFISIIQITKFEKNCFVFLNYYLLFTIPHNLRSACEATLQFQWICQDYCYSISIYLSQLCQIHKG